MEKLPAPSGLRLWSYSNANLTANKDFPWADSIASVDCRLMTQSLNVGGCCQIRFVLARERQALSHGSEESGLYKGNPQPTRALEA